MGVVCRLAAAVAVCAVIGTSPAWVASGTRTSSFVHDSATGLLAQEVEEPNTPAVQLKTDYGYDAFGNKTSVTVSHLRAAVLSSRPELVTGGSALIGISGSSVAPKVMFGKIDVSKAFKPSSKGDWVGLVEGLKEGGNELIASNGDKEAKITLINHPTETALLAGPQQEPFVCENTFHGLARPKDGSCSAPSTVRYFYKSKGGEWKSFDSSQARPSDLELR